MSFVFDWFIDVGTWLQAVSPREGYSELGISVSVVDDYNDILTQSVSEGSGHGWYVTVTNMEQVTHVRRLRRFPYAGVLPLPHVNVKLNPAKVLDLIALVVTNRRQIFKILRM